MDDNDLRRNGSGYVDPTAYEAIKSVDNVKKRIKKLMRVIFAMCDLAGFHLEGRIVLRDKKTGKIWR